jgi:hypothetical protein
VLVLVLVLVATAAAGLRWRLVAGGPAVGAPPSKTIAYVALSRSGARGFAPWLPERARAKVDAVDFKRDALVAVFGDFGCQDALIDVASVEQQGSALAVRLVQHPPDPGTAVCMGIFETYRLLALSKAALHRPYPARASVTLARA